MNKALIIVTRQTGEFDTYWKVTEGALNDNYTKPCVIDIRQDKVILIKNRGWASHYATHIKNIITYDNNVLVNSNDYSLGIIIHRVEPFDTQALNDYKISFCKKYSSSDGAALCEQMNDNFVIPASEPNPPRTGVLDAFRDAYVFNQNEKLPDTFKKLWDFFFGDPILEAKLELLHSLLVPPIGLSKNYVKWNNLNSVARYATGAPESTAWTNFVTQDINGNAEKYHKDPFDEKYIAALTKLRDALLT